MIKLNIDELDRLDDVIVRLKSDINNAYGKTIILRNEMFDDGQFMVHPKSGNIVDIMDWAVDTLIGINEDIDSVELLFHRTKEDFLNNEKELIRTITSINSKLDSICRQLDATIASDQVVVVDRIDDSSESKLEELVSGNIINLKSVNLTALTQVAREEFVVERIEDK